MIFYDVRQFFGNRSTRRIDPRTPEAPIWSRFMKNTFSDSFAILDFRYITFGNRSTRRIDPRTPEASIP